MLKRYKSLKEEVKVLNDSLEKEKIKANNIEQEISILNKELINKKQDIKNQLDIKSKQMFNNILNSNLEEINQLENIIKKYEKDIIESTGIVLSKIDTCEFINFDEFKITEQKIKKISYKLEDLIKSSELESQIEYLKNVDIITMKNNLSISEIFNYIKYYENFDLTKITNNYFKKFINLINKVQDETILVIIIVSFFCLIYLFKYYLIIPYILIFFSTLTIRIRNFVYLIKIANLRKVINEFDNKLEVIKNKSCNYIKGKQTKEINSYKDILLSELKDLQPLILRREDEIRRETEKNFNLEKAKREAEENIREYEKSIEEKICNLEENLNTLKNDINELTNRRDKKQQEFVELKEKIKSSYEELNPNFNSFNMLKEFFLGFDKNENISTFVYKREPHLLIYNGNDKNQFEALLQMIVMMLCQIMCNLTPLAYHINIVDMLTAGTGLMEFTASHTEEQNNLVSLIINDAGYNTLIKNLYSEFIDRGIKIKTSYENIEDYNNDKLSHNARSLPYILNIFYSYNITNITRDMQIKQINKVGSELGIDTIYVFNIAEVEANKKTKNTDKTFKYKFDEYEEFLKEFKEDNIFSFNISNEDMKIVSITKNDLEQIINYNNNDNK